MAIYHLHAGIISRAKGQSVIASCAYRSGSKMTDHRSGLVFNYRRKRHVAHLKIIAPKGAPDWVKKRSKLWNEVEQVEKRKDAQLAREIQISLPKELSHEQQVTLIEEFCKEQFVDKGMVADIAIHDNPGNPHAHVLLTTRAIDENGFGQKVREWNDKDQLEGWREQWAYTANAHLKKAGIEITIDHRTLEEQHKEVENKLSQLVSSQEEQQLQHEEEIMEANTKGTQASRCCIKFAGPPMLNKVFRARMGTAEYLAMLALLFDAENISQDVDATLAMIFLIALANGSLEDHGHMIVCGSGNELETRMAVQLCKQKEWKSIQIEGDDNFCAMAWLEAMVNGISAEKIIGYEPTQRQIEEAKQIMLKHEANTRNKKR